MRSSSGSPPTARKLLGKGRGARATILRVFNAAT